MSSKQLMTLALLAGSCSQLSAQSQHIQKPNILFFLVDDMGIHDTSVPFQYENDQPVINPLNKVYRTPNMEKMAKNGRIFTNAYAYSVCSPTRVSLMMGAAAPRHKVTTWTHPKSSTANIGKVQAGAVKSPDWNQKGLDLTQPTLPEILRKNGYRTLFAGKAHFGPDDTPMGNPKNCGFDVSIAGFGGGGPGGYHGKTNYSAAWRGGGHDWDIPDLEKYHGTDTFLTEAITLEMNEAIEESVKAKKPFFSYMSHYAVHVPFETDDRFKANYPNLKGNQLAFATLVEGMDKSLGDMMKKLNELGVAEETLVIFYSDNGSDGPQWNKPLRGKKGHRHEGGLRVPLMVSWAKVNPYNPIQKRFHIPSGTVDDRMVTCLDIFPSILSFAKARRPKNLTIDGYDRSPYFRGSKKQIGKADFLVHFPHAHNNRLFTAYVLNGKKVIYNYAEESWEFYDLTNDLGEQHNLANSQPEQLHDLGQQMIAEMDRLGADYPINIQTNAPQKPKLH